MGLIYPGCNLTITASYSRIGIRRARKCDREEREDFTINSRSYCADANSSDFFINTFADGIVITVLSYGYTTIEYFYVSAREGHHVCDGTAKKEIARPSGTVEILGKCQLTLYNIIGRISLRSSLPCKERQQLTIDDDPYCPNGNSEAYKDIIGYGFTIAAKDGTPFEIEYSHGKQHACIILHSKELLQLL